MQVLIAGGGVAGVEALLALSELAGDSVDVELISPSEQFVYRPLQVAEPFGRGESISVDMDRIVGDAGARHTRDAFVSVDPRARAITMASGATRSYDALLIAVGARALEAIPGALTFGDAVQRSRFSNLLVALGRRGSSRLTFVVPRQATWSIAAYELALLTAAERDARELRGVELTLITHESAPLELFGRAASDLVAARLEEAGVSLRVEAVAERFEQGELRLAGGDSHAADHVVALPRLEVPPLPGLPQRRGGFVETDVQMHVGGAVDIWAAGDVTSFPIKQGGLAAQQSDVAARRIAARAGMRVPLEPFRPVLRAALITGHAPAYLRARLSDPDDHGASTGTALWAPAAKLAGKYLAPYLARVLGKNGPGQLVDVEPPEDLADQQSAYDRAIAIVLAAADTDAAIGQFEGALRWLALVEDLNLVIPPEYVALREEWRRRLDPAAPLEAAAKRIDPRFDSAAAAISDLQRRLGWLHETELRTGGRMGEQLAAVERGIRDLRRLSKRTGTLRDDHSRR